MTSPINLAILNEIIDENPIEGVKASILKRKFKKWEKQGRLPQFFSNMNPQERMEWQFRIFSANAMKGKYNWFGYDCRSGWAWILTHDKWEKLPRWDGETPCKLWVMAEQGVGDEILFSSCYNELIQQNPDTTFEVDGRLIPMFERSFPGAKFISRWIDEERRVPREITDELPGSFEAFIPAGSVPCLYRRNRRDFPRTAYTKADPEAVARWKERLPGYTGIIWSAGSQLEKHIDPERLAQGHERVCNLHPRVRRSPFLDVEWEDFDDYVALVAALDRVVCVPCAAVHLCGSLGVPCDVVKPSYNNVQGRNTALKWYYPKDRQKMDWYGDHVSVYPSIEAYEHWRR